MSINEPDARIEPDLGARRLDGRRDPSSALNVVPSSPKDADRAYLKDSTDQQRRQPGSHTDAIVDRDA
jgi:hypothetical protein